MSVITAIFMQNHAGGDNRIVKIQVQFMQLYPDFQTRCRGYVSRIQTHPQYVTAKSKDRLGSTWHKPHGVYVSEQWCYYGDKLGICPLLQQAERVISCRPSHCIQHKIEPAHTRTVWVKIMEGRVGAVRIYKSTFTQYFCLVIKTEQLKVRG